jgi:hypothetical protein
VSQYADFKLYWEEWGGYADRAEPFGNPSLLWILAYGENAMACKVYNTPTGSQTATDHAVWQRIPYANVAELPQLLEEISHLDDLTTLVTPPPANAKPEGIYRCVWDLTGAIGNQPFHFSINFCTPGETWTPLGQRLCNVLVGIKKKYATE